MPQKQKNIPCPFCADAKIIVCPKCKGAGKIKTLYYNLTVAGDNEIEETCLLCGGSGKTECPQCSN